MSHDLLEYNATIIERIDHTLDLASFRIRLDEPWDNSPRFVSGQYTTIGLNNDEHPELGSVRRPMSIASAPEDPDGVLEFYVRHILHPASANPLTKLLWDLQKGARIWVKNRAQGTFTFDSTLPPEDNRLRVLVSAGTGLAPFVSMVRSEAQRSDGDLRRFVLCHGASYEGEIAYRDELRRLADSHGLRYFATVSRPSECPGWDGDSGRVEDYFHPDRIAEFEERAGLVEGHLSPQRAVVYVCGLRGTIAETIARLLDRGFVPPDPRIRRALEAPDTVPHAIFHEQYDNVPILDIEDTVAVQSLRDRLRDALERSA